MERALLNELIKWKASTRRKPLVIQGARQVGKTWLMKDFGKKYYDNVAYVSFYNNARMRDVFESDFDIDRILMNIAAETGEKITPERTLIILDEIQDAPKALSSLKSFCEDAPEYHVIVAGSLLGVAIHEGISYPVGKVDEIKLYPMSFEEFLLAMGEDILHDNLVNKRFTWLSDLRDKYVMWLKTYLYVGGMPEAVKYFAEEKDFSGVRRIQKKLLNDYQNDFGKHASGDQRQRITQVWNTIPTQLSKENKKFFFGQIKKGARMKDFELAIQWLVDCGLVHKVTRVTKPGVPLKAYEELEAFKLYMFDVGLISAMCDLNSRVIIDGDNAFTEFKGALMENYVCNQIIANTEYGMYYYSKNTSDFELDFLLSHEDGPVPIEVKASENLRSTSFKNYCSEYKPHIAYRTSLSNYRVEDWMINIPLYAIGCI